MVALWMNLKSSNTSVTGTPSPGDADVARHEVSAAVAEAVARQRALVIVPTYNERENIARLIETVLSQDRRLEVLVVDDGSPDGTAAIVEEIMSQNDRVHILSRPRKMGLGTAYVAGFRWALERGYDLRLRDGRRLLARSRRTCQTSSGR